MSVRIDYEAVNARGVVLSTFSDLAMARAFVRDRACVHDGLHVVEVTVTRRPAYRPRLMLVRSA